VKVHLPGGAAALRRAGLSAEDVIRVLDRVAEETDTTDLVVALYLLPGSHRSRGTAYGQEWMTPSDFRTGRGHWKISLRHPAPESLPDRYKLIRMRLDPDRAAYPRTEHDTYHWVFRYASFSDHLAVLFAHELHHFRRHHLGLHPRGGEHAANRWALETARNLGFDAEGSPLRRPRFKRPLRRSVLPAWLRRPDPHAHLKGLGSGARLVIARDPRGLYAGQEAVLVRPVRSGARRAVVRTADGKVWRWPMDWLKEKTGSYQLEIT
jgi:hypothetical protein